MPLTIVYLDKRDIEGAGLSIDEAIHAVARSIPGPAGINVFDMEAVTTTSDGVMIEGAIIRMALRTAGGSTPTSGCFRWPRSRIRTSCSRSSPI